MFLVTNRAPGGRGFNLADNTTVYLERGETRELNLAPIGAVEKAWVKAGDVVIEEIPEPAQAKEGDPAADKAAKTDKAKG